MLRIVIAAAHFCNRFVKGLSFFSPLFFIMTQIWWNMYIQKIMKRAQDNWQDRRQRQGDDSWTIFLLTLIIYRLSSSMKDYYVILNIPRDTISRMFLFILLLFESQTWLKRQWRIEKVCRSLCSFEHLNTIVIRFLLYVRVYLWYASAMHSIFYILYFCWHSWLAAGFVADRMQQWNITSFLMSIIYRTLTAACLL